jgi:hypothetical protein
LWLKFCLPDGPKFLYNFISCFGDIQRIEILHSDDIFAVFTSKGYIEIWHVPRNPDKPTEVSPRLVKIIEVESNGSITSVLKLYASNDTHRSDSENNHDVPPLLSLMAEANNQNEGDNGRNTKANTPDAPKPAPRRIKRESPSNNKPPTSSIKSGTAKKDIPPEECLWTHGFFLGCEDGEGIILEVSYTLKSMVFSHSIIHRKKLSIAPITITCLNEHDDLFVLAVTSSSNDNYLVGYTAELAEAWQCKADYFKSVSRDKQNRRFQQYRLDHLIRTYNTNASIPNKNKSSAGSHQQASNVATVHSPDETVVGLTSEGVFKKMFVSLQNGAVLSLSCLPIINNSQVPNPAANPTVPNTSKKDAANPVDNSVRRDIFVSFCLDVRNLLFYICINLTRINFRYTPLRV